MAGELVVIRLQEIRSKDNLESIPETTFATLFIGMGNA